MLTYAGQPGRIPPQNSRVQNVGNDRLNRRPTTMQCVLYLFVLLALIGMGLSWMALPGDTTSPRLQNVINEPLVINENYAVTGGQVRRVGGYMEIREGVEEIGDGAVVVLGNNDDLMLD